MRTIWKYQFDVDPDKAEGSEFNIEMPVVWVPHLIGCQDWKPTLWAEVDTDANKKSFRFHIIKTGEPIPKGLIHIGSFQQPPYVWHLWCEAQRNDSAITPPAPRDLL